MMRCSGTESSSIIVLLVRYGTSFTPGISGTVARPPTLMKIRSAVSARPPTSSVRGALKRAWPRISVTFFMPSIHFPRPSVDCFTTPSLRAFTAFMSTRTSPALKPYSPPRRAMWIARALPTSVLVGMQPTFTQVPPRSFLSTIAVLSPSESRRAHNAGPACPAPMTMASKRSAMGWLLVRLCRMRLLAASVAFAMVNLTVVPSTTAAAGESPEAGVSLALAQARAKQYRDLHYAVHLKLTEGQDRISGSLEIRFKRLKAKEDLVLDWRGKPVENLGVNGNPVAVTISNEHLVVPAKSLKAGVN